MIVQLDDLNKEMGQVEAAVKEALSLAKQKGASDAECSISQTSGISVGTRLGEVETVEFNQDGALGITVYRGNQKGSASTTDLSKHAIEAAVENAMEKARTLSEAAGVGLRRGFTVRSPGAGSRTPTSRIGTRPVGTKPFD